MTTNDACIVGGVDMTELYPAPFPDELPTAQLGNVSLARLIVQDRDESQRILDFARNPGFFNLDLSDHPDGIALLQNVADCCRLSKRLFHSLAHDQKTEFKTRLGSGAGILDMGYVLSSGSLETRPQLTRRCSYWTKTILPSGEVKYNEIMNVISP